MFSLDGKFKVHEFLVLFTTFFEQHLVKIIEVCKTVLLHELFCLAAQMCLLCIALKEIAFPATNIK